MRSRGVDEGLQMDFFSSVVCGRPTTARIVVHPQYLTASAVAMDQNMGRLTIFSIGAG